MYAFQVYEVTIAAFFVFLAMSWITVGQEKKVKVQRMGLITFGTLLAFVFLTIANNVLFFFGCEL